VHLLALRAPTGQRLVFLDAQGQIEDFDLLHDARNQSARQQGMPTARASVELVAVATTRESLGGEESTLMWWVSGLPPLRALRSITAGARRFQEIGRRRFGGSGGVLVLGGQLGLEFGKGGLEILDLLLQCLQLLLQDLALWTRCCGFLHGRLP